jgi:hypothetical protein
MIGPEEAIAEHRREQRHNGVMWLAVALILAITVGAAYRIDKRADMSDKLRADSNAQVDRLKGQVHANGQIAQSAKAAAEEANRRLAAAGKPTVPVPPEAPVSPTVAPSAGVTDAEVRSIVSSAIRAYSPTLSPAQVEQVARVAAPKVVKPKDGKSPTPAELQPLVAVAVTTFCGEDRCAKQGPKGDSAPPVSDERLSALIDTSLAAYCAAHNGCAGADSTVPGPVGPTGPVGPEGPVGEQGRSVVDTDCLEDGRWRVTYDKPFPDGEKVRYSRGPCRVAVVPTDPPPEAKKAG